MFGMILIWNVETQLELCKDFKKEITKNYSNWETKY